MIVNLDPSEMNRDELAALVSDIREKLWPGGDVDHEWSADTLMQIAGLLTDAGLRPEEK